MSEDSFEFQINQEESKPIGGTELIYNRVVDCLDDELKDEFIIIPQRVREEHLKDSRKKILWLHDLAEDPESEHLKYEDNRQLFEKFVFPSNWALWEYHQKLGVPLENSVVIPNCIEPIPVHEKPKGLKKKIIYFMITQIQQASENSTTQIQLLLIQMITIMMSIGVMNTMCTLTPLNIRSIRIQLKLQQNPFFDILYAQSLN